MMMMMIMMERRGLTGKHTHTQTEKMFIFYSFSGQFTTKNKKNKNESEFSKQKKQATKQFSAKTVVINWKSNHLYFIFSPQTNISFHLNILAFLPDFFSFFVYFEVWVKLPSNIEKMTNSVQNTWIDSFSV